MVLLANKFVGFNLKGSASTNIITYHFRTGLQQPLDVGVEAKWKDKYDSENPLRMFHYLKYKIANDTIKLTLNILEEDLLDFDKSYQVVIPLN